MLHAPCDGEVVALPASRHAVTRARRATAPRCCCTSASTRSALRGEGFEALVQLGDAVAAGTPLLRFDLDGAGTARAQPPDTGDRRERGLFDRRRVANASVRVGDRLLRIARDRRRSMAARSPREGAPFTTSVAVTVGLDHGLHARPAARIVASGSCQLVRGQPGGERSRSRRPQRHGIDGARGSSRRQRRDSFARCAGS